MSLKTNDELRLSPIHLLHRAGQSAEEIFHGEMTNDVTPRQLAVLMTIARNEGINQTGIVDATGIDRSTLAEIARRLVKRRLLQRRRTKEDAHSYAIRLTDEGHRVLRATEPLARRVTASVRERFVTLLTECRAIG